MPRKCTGCGKSLALGVDIIFELGLSLKCSGTQVISKGGEWLSEYKSFCEECHEKEKDVDDFKRIKHCFIMEDLYEKI
jgi:hypothetical protein